jgi:CDP-glucose 4,6-dehydratase
MSHDLFNGIYRNRRVLVTGHTGFKGSWLCAWLQELGAQVSGYALAPYSDPNHFSLIGKGVRSHLDDLLNQETLTCVFAEQEPEIVFHLAAQPLVRRAYREPWETYQSNVMGTLAMLEAARSTSSVRAVVAITTDKVYHNHEWEWGYREEDRLGGYDPYSSSKACAEILLQSYRQSYWNLSRYGKDHHVLLATARAGNVVGGGDWSEDRLVPDLMKAAAAGSKVPIRSPNAIRPWQHVLDCLSGYLILGQRLLQQESACASSFNFGPVDEDALSVREVVSRITQHWPAFSCEIIEPPARLHEAGFLKLDCSRAHAQLHWKPVWNAEDAFRQTTNWYRDYYQHNRANTAQDIADYIACARQRGLVWA